MALTNPGYDPTLPPEPMPGNVNPQFTNAAYSGYVPQPAGFAQFSPVPGNPVDNIAPITPVLPAAMPQPTLAGDGSALSPAITVPIAPIPVPPAIPGDSIPNIATASAVVAPMVAAASAESPTVAPQRVQEPGIALLNKVLPYAVQYEASDVYMVVNYYPSLKIHGKIQFLTEGFNVLTTEDVKAFVYALMNHKQQQVYEEELELDFAYTHVLSGGRFRVNVFTQMKQPSCTLRYLRSDIPSIDSLGLPPICKWLAERPSGIILLAGPTGSGKSTTLSAMVDHINSTVVKHIITIEDPVEYLHPLKKSIVEQREVGSDCISFARAMKSALRQNPNVVVLGEMRDLESVASAITIAETGHLVFSTIHARSSIQTINKIVDSFPAEQQAQIRQQISETLLSVISQRLVPAKAAGKQLMAMEIMIVNSAIANMIREKQTHQVDSVIQTSKKEGMLLLDDDLMRLVQEDKITIEEALKNSNTPQSLNSKFISVGLVR